MAAYLLTFFPLARLSWWVRCCLAFRHGERRTASYPANLDRNFHEPTNVSAVTLQLRWCPGFALIRTCLCVFHMIAKKDQKVGRCCFINTGLLLHHTLVLLLHPHETLSYTTTTHSRASSSSTQRTHTLPQRTQLQLFPPSNKSTCAVSVRLLLPPLSDQSSVLLTYWCGLCSVWLPLVTALPAGLIVLLHRSPVDSSVIA